MNSFLMMFRFYLLRPFFLGLLISLLFFRCTNKPTETTTEKNAPLFKLLPASQTGVTFNNQISEGDTMNVLTHAYIYNGAGVGVGDFNQDGLMDIYFAANMVSNKLYLNKGAMKFEDVTQAAGVTGEGKWCLGVSVIDINNDGRLDIYVSASFYKNADRRKNLLYINQGNNAAGIPSFKESAAAYGLADTGYSTQGVFFDYDQDGDLDIFVLTNILDENISPIDFRPKITDGSALNNDRLYRNNGNETFTNVTRQAGILIEGYGHAVSISDVNLDGWPDIYVSNDFIAPDVWYINNRNGTFTNRVSDYINHMGWSVMGTDIVDINNDGMVDMIALEMLPERNMRKKVNLNGNAYITYINNSKYNYEHQYIRNVLQMNQGMTPDGHPMFSEVAFMAGVYQTDWSWTPLVADYDNDGFRDMVISNGYPRDVTDLDYVLYDNGQSGNAENTTLAMVDSFPVVKIPNYGFRNTGGIVFADSSQAWGLDQSSNSNGSVYADLDNDGDLDMVMSNINDPAFIYENTTNSVGKKGKEHFLTLSLIGSSTNKQGLGASVRLYYGGSKQQLYEHQPCRGYLSTVDDRAHFGLGATTQVDSIRVRWPDGKTQLLTGTKADQTLVLSYANANGFAPSQPQPSTSALFASVASQYGIQFKHQERDAVDYNIQRTLPHKFSQYGPGIAVGDVDNNGFDDFYVGGAAGKAGVFFMQDAKGHFSKDANRVVRKDENEAEETGVLLFDADNDNDLDMYSVRGSYEFAPLHPSSQDRLYLNDGKGKFQWAETALPVELSNGSCVRAADYDADGDLDLFVGGRVISGEYPSMPNSYLLSNVGGTFVDVTEKYFPDMHHLGLITDALWTDFDQDSKVDLMLVGEWMPITFYKNTGEGFVSVNETSGIKQHMGWWNSLVAGDFDQDGDLDYVAGNLGLNSNFKATSEQPMTLYAKDLDANGRLEAMIFCFMKAEDGIKRPFPMHTRDDLMAQMPSLKKRYFTYHSFGSVTMDELWGSVEKENAQMLQATDMRTSYIENKGNGKFAIRPLPMEAQIAPVYGMVSKDIDGDGKLDLMLVGNDYGMEPFSGRHDAFMGLCLKGDGKGNFRPLSIAQSGFFVKGDAKGLATVLTAKNEEMLVATQNQDSLKVFTSKTLAGSAPAQWIKLNADDFSADLVYKDNRKRRVEFYYGSTYLSQSSRQLRRDPLVAKVVITDFKGRKREVK
ncbi:MAG: VCBS repeat-containing protein [Bacteroidota bacterium]